jgi:hypothetical protein
MQSSVLCAGVDRNILASVSLDLQMALTFSLGAPPNAGEVRRDANTAKAANAETFFISTPQWARNERERTRRRCFGSGTGWRLAVRATL